MRFLIKRILKNFPSIYKHWLAFINYIDFKHYDKYCSDYKIIPMGDNCIPRVISTINRLKPTKKYGEKTYPFDLCFSDFYFNTLFIDSNFNNFFENIEFDPTKKYYVNKKNNYYFNHDYMSFEEFKSRYLKRIDNLYNALADTTKHIYFLISTTKPIQNENIDFFINTINKYRDCKTYSIIIINRSNQKKKYIYNNVYSIDLLDDKSFKKINKNGDWVNELKSMKDINARIFNHKINSKLSKIIKQHKK